MKYYNIYAGAHPSEYASTAKLDEFKNPVSNDFNLGRDGAFGSKFGGHQYTILIGNFFHRTGEFKEEAFNSNAGNALREKGLDYKLVHSEVDFIREIKRTDINGHEYDAAIFISSDAVDYYDRENNNNIEKWRYFATACEEYSYKGFGLFIFADNTPFVDHANVVIERLFGFKLEGNNEGQKILEFDKQQYECHLITTGLQTIYEGHTVCYPDLSYDKVNSDCKVLARGSDKWKSPVIMYAEGMENRGRVVIDTGFTKLWLEWKQAGTDRYINNAVVWLLGIDWRINMGYPLHGPISFRTIPPKVNPNIPLNPPPLRPTRSDFILLMDGSGSVYSDDFDKMKSFTINVITLISLFKKI